MRSLHIVQFHLIIPKKIEIFNISYMNIDIVGKYEIQYRYLLNKAGKYRIYAKCLEERKGRRDDFFKTKSIWYKGID